MKLCIFGAGATGGHLAARLGGVGDLHLSVIARGAQLQAIRASGLRLYVGDRVIESRMHATDDPTSLGPQDVVIVAVKAPALAHIVDGIDALRKPDTAIVYALNGIPWWYSHGIAPNGRAQHLNMLDPGGRLWSIIGPESAVGCVVYSANEVTTPGTILNRSPKRNRFVLGAPDGRPDARIAEIARILEKGGIEAPVSTDIRADIWRKFLVGNLTLAVLATLTMSTADALAADGEMASVCRSVVGEGRTLAAALGVNLGDFDPLPLLKPENIPAGNRPSMLQDLELGRPLEIDAFVTAVQELASEAGVAMPTFATIAALLKMRARTAGLWSPLAAQ